MKHIRVYEHRQYKVNETINGIVFKPEYLKRLQEYHEKNNRFYSLINNGVKFCEYVGILKVGDLVIEVLPKTDGNDYNDATWQQFLIKMLKASGILEVEQTGFTSLKLKRNSILDLYMELFLQEVQYLLHTGIVKKYRKTEGNSFTMKGGLMFGKNIQHNLTHAERFYVRYSVYDKDNIFNSLLLKAINLTSRIGNPTISATAQSILLDFPDCRDVNANEATFSKLIYNRKTESYRKAINMARLLLLNYHPDIQNGQNDVLALMFDMNKLWEKYVFKRLRIELNNKYPGAYLIKEQVRNNFWQPEQSYMRIVKPDIVIYDADDTENSAIVVLDTKWKQLKDNRPDDNDLKQMLVYNLYNTAKKSALVYPVNVETKEVTGIYQKGYGNCSLFFLHLVKKDNELGIELDVVVNFIENGRSNSPCAHI